MTAATLAHYTSLVAFLVLCVCAVAAIVRIARLHQVLVVFAATAALTLIAIAAISGWVRVVSRAPDCEDALDHDRLHHVPPAASRARAPAREAAPLPPTVRSA